LEYSKQARHSMWFNCRTRLEYYQCLFRSLYLL